MAPALPNVSPDLVWEIVRNNNCFLSKSNRNGGVQFSRDPLNLTNKSSRKHAGFVNDKAIGVVAHDKGGVTVITKKTSNANKPAKAFTRTTYGGNKSNRKTYKAVAHHAASSGYRGDLRSAAVERVSAIRRTQLKPKPDHEPKLRGNKAKKAAELS
ncbi:ribosomal l28e protein family protein [Hirsutella rhossiliensis]|uniref:Ribosomal l28e protein family domain-containing protein n=1 Tax=Hirsutella rhossiliensis TaxID=111463 RepID=A0A9P8SFH8_9HYPO|nr:ribosomal l28e protein family domain-containing protein [Hirsutella rhossiliensis]KAH0960049.1 ribosomal l28e protein family domain-containing protein [Hirsutella rhossiliensis]